jgi:hypothetical protein
MAGLHSNYTTEPDTFRRVEVISGGGAAPDSKTILTLTRAMLAVCHTRKAQAKARFSPLQSATAKDSFGSN